MLRQAPEHEDFAAQRTVRAERLAEVINEVARALDREEPIDWADIEHRHAGLMPELGEQLATLRDIVEAGHAADAHVNAPTSPPRPTSDALIDVLNAEIPGYRFLEVIHRGGQGTVLKAIQLSTSRHVAVKVMQDGPIASEHRRQRFAREIQLTSRLQLPNVVSVFDSGIVRDRYYFIMQYVDGSPVDDYALLHALSARQRIQLFVAIVRAISRAHQRGVIHRDIKPSNILIDAEGTPQILDFGLAKAVLDIDDGRRATLCDATTASPSARDRRVRYTEPACRFGQEPVSLVGHVVGTLPYLSPEQASGFDDVDVRSDIYALGVVLFELLTGEFPYSVEGDRSQVRNRILHQPARRLREVIAPDTDVHGDRDGWTGFPPPQEIDDDIEAIVARALAKDKAERYQSADQLAADLDSYLRGDAVMARADQGAYLLRKTLRRYRRHLIVAAAFAAMLTLATVMTTTSWLHARDREERARRVASLAHATLNQVVTEIDETIKPLAGGLAARDRLLVGVAERLTLLEPLVAADEAMGDVLRALHEKQGDIAQSTGKGAEARTHYEVLIGLLGPVEKLELLADGDLQLLAGIYRKLARVSSEPEEHLRRSVEVAQHWVGRSPSFDAAHLSLCASLVDLARQQYLSGRYDDAADTIDDALVIVDQAAGRNIDAQGPGRYWRELTADALEWDGDIRTKLGDSVRGIASLEQSRAARAALCDERPYDVDARHNLMLSLVKLSSALRDHGDIDAALTRAGEAIDHGRYLVRVDPQTVAWTRDLIGAEVRISNLNRIDGDHRSAIDHSSAAVSMAEGLVQIEPENPMSQRMLAFAHLSRGESLRRAGHLVVALDDLRRAVEIIEELVQQLPRDAAHLEDLATARQHLSSCLAALGRGDDARTEQERALLIRQELLDRQPDTARRYLELAGCLINLAAWHCKSGRQMDDDHAISLLDRAEDILHRLENLHNRSEDAHAIASYRKAISNNRAIVATRHEQHVE